jgi:hypothetical protein
MGALGQGIDDGDNGIVASLCSRQLGDEVDVDPAPPLLGDRQWLQKSIRLLVRWLCTRANPASSDIAFNLLKLTRPEEASRDCRMGTKCSKVPTSR